MLLIGVQAVSALLIILARTPNAVAQDSAPTQRPAPIDVSGQSTKSLSLIRLVLRPDFRSEVLEATRDLLDVISMQIKKYGYNVIGTADETVFKKSEAANAEMMLGGTINRLECEREKKYANMMSCDIGIAWELYDSNQDKVVYKVTTRHRREVFVSDWRNPKREAVVEEEVNQLLYGALNSLLAREQFVSLMQKSGDEWGSRESAAPQYETADIAVCKGREIKMPKGAPKVIEATMIVKAGQAVGSAFFVSPDGYALTAAHVVDGFSTVKVKNNKGGTFDAAVVRIDKKSDTALLKVDVTKSPCLVMLTELPSVGEELHAVGAPGGEELAFTLSKGIVSAVRELNGQSVVQTDTSLNPGNSGGPLVDPSGRVVAVVSSKVTVPGFEGLGFGVPVQTALSKLSLRVGGRTTVDAIPVVAVASNDADALVGQDDPPLAELPVEQTTHPRVRVFSVKEKLFYHPMRYALLASGPVLILTGVLMGMLSYNSFNDQAYEYPSSDSEPFPGSDTEYHNAMDPDELTKLKVVNIVGWSMVGVGTAMFATFFLTRRSSKKLERMEAEQGKSALRTKPTVDFILTPDYAGLKVRF